MGIKEEGLPRGGNGYSAELAFSAIADAVSRVQSPKKKKAYYII